MKLILSGSEISYAISTGNCQFYLFNFVFCSAKVYRVKFSKESNSIDKRKTSWKKDEIVTEYEIHILPLLIVYRSKTYRDRIKIKPQEVYNSLEKEIPKTSMPSIEDTKKLLDKLKEEGYTPAITITISSTFSGTYEMLNAISKEYKEMKIKVIDLKSLSMGLEFIVYEVAKAVKNGRSFEDACMIAEKVKGKMRIFLYPKDSQIP
ncbi:MAG: DegV family protein [Athalassotoga sp.]